jgi:hypothetical protein
MYIQVASVSAVLLLSACAPASAQGLWFDIGSGGATRIHCEDDELSWIEFGPYPFGESWPRGTLVYAELERRTDDKLAVVYSIKFNDGGCGCGRDLYKPVAYQFHYSESAVKWLEASTTLYKRNGELWEKEAAILNTQTNVFSGSYWGFIVGVPTFGIGSSNAFEEQATSWGRVKAMYGGSD